MFCSGGAPGRWPPGQMPSSWPDPWWCCPFRTGRGTSSRVGVQSIACQGPKPSWWVPWRISCSSQRLSTNPLWRRRGLLARMLTLRCRRRWWVGWCLLLIAYERKRDKDTKRKKKGREVDCLLDWEGSCERPKLYTQLCSGPLSISFI